jgi:NAD(P)-dependent dehydrogenase (short-subunit alcohol dehydrogenase family)
MDTMHPQALFALTGKSALVTGASRGIGLAIAETFARAGARVVLSSEDPAACAEVAARLRNAGLDVHAVACNAADHAEVQALAARAQAACDGRIDILVCNAGVAGPHGPLAASSDADWEQVMTINLRSALWLTSLLVPAMAARRDGSVIVTASLSALRGNRSIGLYGISKAGLLQLVRNLAVEWGPSNVRANAISPGVIRTDFARPIVDDDQAAPRRQQLTPLRRFGEPAEIAGVALMLAAPAGAFITGQNIIVDGGTLIGDGS